MIRVILAWPDRDRFVLSAGHGSAWIYAALHLSGYDLPMEQLEKFRQWGSLTPGHPERDPHHVTPGVEVTTGPARAGLRQRGRPGDGRGVPARQVRRGGPEPPHVRDLLGRRPHGGHRVGGGVDRGAEGARQARLPLRRQRHLAGRSDVAELQRRGRDEALRGLRLARARSSRTSTTSRRCARRSRPPATTRSARRSSASRRSSATRRRTSRARARRTARRSATTRSAPPRRRSGSDPDQKFHVPDEVYAAFSAQEKGTELRTAWEERFKAFARRAARAGEGVGRRVGAASRCPASARRWPTSTGATSRSPRAVAGQKAMAAFEAAHPDDGGRRGRPLRVDEDRVPECGRVHGREAGPQRLLGRARARHGRARSTAWRRTAASCGRTARRSCSSPTTCAARCG